MIRKRLPPGSAREHGKIPGENRADTAADDDRYPVKLEIELTNWNDLGHFIGFLRYVRATANAGHSFTIEADREEGSIPEFMRKFGLTGAYPKVEVDGDGVDRIGRIFVNGEEIK